MISDTKELRESAAGLVELANRVERLTHKGEFEAAEIESRALKSSVSRYRDDLEAFQVSQLPQVVLIDESGTTLEQFAGRSFLKISKAALDDLAVFAGHSVPTVAVYGVAVDRIEITKRGDSGNVYAAVVPVNYDDQMGKVENIKRLKSHIEATVRLLQKQIDTYYA